MPILLFLDPNQDIVLHNSRPISQRLNLLLRARHQAQDLTLALRCRHDLIPPPPRIRRPPRAKHLLRLTPLPAARRPQVHRPRRNIPIEQRPLKHPQSRLGLVTRHHMPRLKHPRKRQVPVLPRQAIGHKRRALRRILAGVRPRQRQRRVPGRGERVAVPVRDRERRRLAADPVAGVVAVAVHQVHFDAVVEQVRELGEVPVARHVARLLESQPDDLGAGSEVHGHAQRGLHPVLVEPGQVVVAREGVGEAVRDVEPAELRAANVRPDKDPAGGFGGVAAVCFYVGFVDGFGDGGGLLLEGFGETLAFGYLLSEAAWSFELVKLAMLGGLVDGLDAIGVIPCKIRVGWSLDGIIDTAVDDA